MKLFEVTKKHTTQSSPFDEIPSTDRQIRSNDPKRIMNHYSGKREVYLDYLDGLWRAVRDLDGTLLVWISHRDLGSDWLEYTFAIRSHLGTYLYVNPKMDPDAKRAVSRYTNALKQFAPIEVPYRRAHDQFERDQNLKRMRADEAKRKRDERNKRAKEYQRQQAKIQRDLARAAKAKPTP